MKRTLIALSILTFGILSTVEAKATVEVTLNNQNQVNAFIQNNSNIDIQVSGINSIDSIRSINFVPYTLNISPTGTDVIIKSKNSGCLYAFSKPIKKDSGIISMVSIVSPPFAEHSAEYCQIASNGNLFIRLK